MNKRLMALLSLVMVFGFVVAGSAHAALPAGFAAAISTAIDGVATDLGSLVTTNLPSLFGVLIILVGLNVILKVIRKMTGR